MRAGTQRPFDLSAGPVLRAHLAALTATEHVLFLAFPHVAFDAWSARILNRELGALYAAFHAGEPSPLAELPIQYADYAAWQRGWLRGPVLDRQLAYWKEQLAGAPTALELPTDRPRPRVRSSRGAEARFAVAPGLTRALEALARREGATLFMTLLAAFAVLLQRYTGQDDLVVGSPIAGRTRTETEDLIGFFLDTLVLRARFAEVVSFRDLLQQVRATCLGAYAHQDMPFERLVQELHPDPDPGRSPVFQVIFNLQNTPREALSLQGIEVTAVETHGMTVKVDLSLIMAPRDGGLAGVVHFSTDLFDASTVERLVGHFVTLLEGVAADVSRPLGELPLLAADERHRLLVTWNETAAVYPEGETVHGLFEARAHETPEDLALVAGDERLSFRELDARANRVAQRLRALGVGPDAAVGLAMDRSAGLVVGLLGILKAGGAYVPLDPASPGPRLTRILADAGARVVVTRAGLDGALPVEGVTRVLADAASLEGESDARVESGAGPEHLVYVLFTSGSTGAPKGVAVEHRQLVNYVRGVSSRLGLPAGASYALVSTFAADLGNTVLFPPLCLGGTLHLLAEDLTTAPERMAAYVEHHGVDCLKIVPSHLAALLAGARPERVLPRRVLVLGGEASSWELVEKVHALSPALRILNHYGPTEATVGALTYAVDRATRAPAPIVPLGRPLPNTRVYLLDARGEPVPVGVPGEIFLGGAGVARGYLGLSDLTAERFVRDPFAGLPTARMYRTGDRARYLPDGALVFLGRADHQVKIRGFRVELGEIEATLAAHADVRQAVVLAPEDAAGTRSLVAYVVRRAAPVSGSAPDAAALRAYLEHRLPAYMVPPALVLLEALPLTPNGKIDRAALPALAAAPAGTSAESELGAPRTPVEEVLAGIWADVFERGTVGVHDRFADLGGHSLLAIQIIARARDAFQCDVPLRAIFEAPTVACLAERVEEALRESEGPPAPPVTREPRGGPLALSFAQERLWLLDQIDPGSAAYNVPMSLRFTGDLDVAALSRALGELSRRHEVLRTTFAAVAGKAVQIVHDSGPARLPVEDLGGLPAAEREEAAIRAAEVEARRPFDLAAGPLLRARLLRLGPADHALLLTLHHIVSDAWTRGILDREIGALYEAFHAGRPPDLAELPVQYADYAAWQRRRLAGPTLDRLLAYWTAHLRGAPPALDLPTDRPRPPVRSDRGGRRALDLPPALAGALADLGRGEGATLYMITLAAFAVLLHRHTGEEDLVVGTPVANRIRPETDGLLGFFVNTLALRLRVTPDLPFRDLLARVREACLGGYTHQELPFERLVQELAPERDLGRTPLFQVMFAYQNERAEKLSLPGLELRPFAVSSGTSKFDLTLSLTHGTQGLRALVEYATDLFDGATIERLLARYQVLLEGIVHTPDARLGDLPILPDAERRLLLSTWNGVRPTGAEPLCLHERFEQQVDRTPDAIAATLGEQSLTYRELDTRSNRLAHHLRARGVGPEVLVGLCTERSLDMLIGMLAILKAGGAYVPLDPEYPRERLAFMAADAKLRLVVTEQPFADLLPVGERVLLDASAAAIAAEPPHRPAPSAAPSSLAYVIYTSGSTGKPKGALVEHRNVTRLFTVTEPLFGFAPSDVWTLFHSYAFDFSVWEIWGALLHGGRVVVVPRWVSRDPDVFYPLLARERVTVLNQTPSAFRQLARVDEEAAPELRAALALRWVVFGGEALDVGDLRGFWARHGDETPRLVNMYGITETTVHVTHRPLGRADLERPTASVIGRPLADLQVYVLDARRSLVPVGVTGEMYVGGAGVSRGYLDRAELTEARFVPDPFGDDPSARLYRTGDLARYRASGELEYLGRADQQVKIRGFRIELGEIEAALSAHASVREAVVVVRGDPPGDRRLVAYLVCAAGEALTIAELRAFLKESLPDVMVPAAFVVLPALPLTANGKVDLRALPAPDLGPRADLAAEGAGPRTPAEEALARTWAEVLRVEAVGLHDNFFELGGDSILAIQIVARARDAGVRVTPRQLFQHQTLAELAAHADTTGAVTAEQGAITGPVALTPIQRWWLDQDVADPHHHNQAFLLEAREPLDPPALAAALAALVAHHDMLRLRLAREGASFRQTIAAPGEPVTLGRVDLSRLEGAALSAAIEEAAAAAQTHLDLGAGPILCAVLFDAGRAPQRLLLAVHHLAVDGVSWRILLEDLWTAYTRARRGEATALPPKTTSFRRWAEALAAHARSDAMRDEEPFWLAEAERDGGRLPARTVVESLEGSTRTVLAELDARETEQLLREVPEAYRTQMNDVLLTAFAEAMAPWVGSRRVLVNLEGHGREEVIPDADLTRTVGWFTTLFPVVLDLGVSAGPGAALTRVKEQLRRIPGRGLGYGLLRWLREGDATAERLAAGPRAEVSFNYLGQLDQALPTHEGSSPFAFAGESPGPASSPRARRAHALDVQASVRGGRLRVRFAYGDGHLRRDDVEALAARFLASLRALIAHCLTPGAGGYTPSDFTKADLTQEDIGDLLDQLDDEA